MEEFGFWKTPNGTRADRHPTTQVPVKGRQVPYWEGVRETLKYAHRLLSNIHSIGWDIAITKEGPVVLEGNDNWETVFIQLYGGSRSLYDRYFR